MSAMKPRLILLVGVLATAPMSANGDTSLTITGAAGEFENRQATERYTAELRQSVVGDSYAILYGAHHNHPRPEIEDRVMAGIGYAWRGWNAEFIGDDDRYLTRLIYTADTEVWELRGGVLHGNKWAEGFKQTGLLVSVGYPVLPSVSAGAFYEIGNTTMVAVDDLYGGYLSWHF